MLKLVTAFTPRVALTVPKAFEPITRNGADPFAALHDLVWLHSAELPSGLQARLYETWDAHDEEDPGARLLLALGLRGGRASVWDLGCVAESALGLSFEGPGHVVVTIEPRLDRQQSASPTIDVRYSREGRSIAAIVRVGARLLARTALDKLEPFASVERVHDADLENDEFLHARLFERSCERTMLLQLSGPCGETRTFDLGIALEVSTMEVDDEGLLVVDGRKAGGARVELSARVLDGTVALVRIQETSANSARVRRRAKIATR